MCGYTSSSSVSRANSAFSKNIRADIVELVLIKEDICSHDGSEMLPDCWTLAGTLYTHTVSNAMWVVCAHDFNQATSTSNIKEHLLWNFRRLFHTLISNIVLCYLSVMQSIYTVVYCWPCNQALRALTKNLLHALVIMDCKLDPILKM